MEILQDFALENIHCAPWEDRQFRFSLVRITKPREPVKRFVRLFNRQFVELPDIHTPYHVYGVGRIPATFLNLKAMKGCRCACADEKWINMEEDMNERNFIFQMYDETGLNLPRRNIYYRLTHEGSILIAVKVDNVITKLFDIEKFKYIRTYTNHYYQHETSEDTITITGRLIGSKRDVIDLRRYVESLNKRGTTLFYYNGVYHEKLDNNLVTDVFVEIMHDTGIRRVEKYKIEDLTTFQSIKDKKMKYLIYRDQHENYIQYADDLEVYIVATDEANRKVGLYYYQNRDEALRNVTDKDYSILSDYVFYHARLLAEEHKMGVQENEIYIFVRDPMFRRSLVYSALKIHELYRLPASIEKNVLNNTGYTISDFRVENLENSLYWKIAGMEDLTDLTKEMAMEAVGYSAAVYYYGNTPSKVVTNNVPVPYLYQGVGYGYEYNEDGIMTGYQETYAPMYPIMREDTKYVEFIQGRSRNYRTLHEVGDEVYVDVNRDYRIISAMHYKDEGRVEDWKDITESDIVTIGEDGRVHIKGDKYTIGSFRVVYLDEPYIVDFHMNMTNYLPLFTLHTNDTINGHTASRPLDIYFDTLEVFLNGHRLVQDVDYFMDFPTISIANKQYLRYGSMEQHIHIRATGFALTKEGINAREVRGYVNHGALSRNNFYDIRDDRVFTTYVDGKLIPREEVIFADDDNTLRIADPSNGKPYAINDRIISIKPVSGLPTYPEYIKSIELNDRISGLYNLVYPEPKIDPFNVIGERHLLFSPLISTIIRDVLRGAIPPDFYTRYYQAIPIRDMLDEKYPILMSLDPLNNDIDHKLNEVHPDYGNDEITVDVFQYRFIYNVIKVLTGGRNELVNLSGYLHVDRDETEYVDKEMVHIVDPRNQGLIPFD